jgi:hypothetical protein
MSNPQGPQPYQQNRPQYGQQYGQPYGPPQHYRPPQPYPGPQSYGQQYVQPSEGIAVKTEFFVLAFMLSFVKPKIFVDGQEMPVQGNGWGRTVIPARPGRHHVHVYTPYFLPPQLGPADASVDVHPGQVAELEYRAPLFAWSPGSLGVPPQKYNGVGITIAIAVIPVVMVLFFIFIAIIASI